MAQTCPLAGDVAANLDEHLRLLERAAAAGAQIVVFPELSLTVCADIGHASHAQQAAARGAGAYLASMFVIPSDFAGDAAKLSRYAAQHALLVGMANFGSPSSGIAAAGRSSIWSPVQRSVINKLSWPHRRFFTVCSPGYAILGPTLSDAAVKRTPLCPTTPGRGRPTRYLCLPA